MAHGRLRATLAAGILAVLAAAGCQSSPPPAASESAGPSASVAPSIVPDAASLTAYDGSAPIAMTELGEPETDAAGISVHDVTWPSPGGGEVSAWLVVPPGDGPFAGMVYLHGSETDRNDFLDEAVAMAHGGVVSVVMDAPFARAGESRHDYLLNFGRPERELAMNAQAIIDLRRAYDLLTFRPDVDPTRLGFVGHSWGASAGAILAAVDPRPSALVLVSGRPSWTGFLRDSTDQWVDSYRELYGPEKWARYLEMLAPFDALAEIGGVDGARLYLQYGTLDDVVPVPVAQLLLDAAPAAKVDLYDAGHALDDMATADRVAWLVEVLGLGPIDAEIVAGVGLPDE